MAALAAPGLLLPNPNPNPSRTVLPFFPSPPLRSRTLSLRLPTHAGLRPGSRALARAAGASFLPPISENPSAYLRPPLIAALAGLARWLGLFREVLLVRVLLTWFPNIPWDRQPFSALRDLCDPFLALVRNVLPPFLGKIDVSPLLAFAVLEMVISLLRVQPAM